LNTWFEINKLSLNIENTCYMVFSSSPKKCIKLVLNDIDIQNVHMCVNILLVFWWSADIMRSIITILDCVRAYIFVVQEHLLGKNVFSLKAAHFGIDYDQFKIPSSVVVFKKIVKIIRVEHNIVWHVYYYYI